MAGYANRVIMLRFDELSEDDDLVHVVMRNPKLLPLDELKPDKNIAIGPDGQPLDEEAAENDMYERLAKLIVGWHVYDSTMPEPEIVNGQPRYVFDENASQKPLPLPATAASVRKLPNLIQQAILKEVEKVANPPE